MSFKRIVPLLAGAISLGIVGSASAASYVVLANGNNLSARMTSEIEAAGGRITSMLPQIGVALVEADANFAANASGISGLQSIAADLSFQYVDEFTAPSILSDSGISNQETGDGSYPADSLGFL